LLFSMIVCVCNAMDPSSQKFDSSPNWRPVVLMHGLMAGSEAMSHAQGWIEQDFPGIYTHNVEIGDGRMDSLFMDINLQVEQFAIVVQNDSKLKDGFNLVCHSQGGLICRAYIERYNNPPVYNYLSWAGPQDGVYGTPDVNYLCPDDYCPWLNDLMDLVEEGGWISQEFQSVMSFAAYWKDPFNYDVYIQENIFLADINNERNITNSTYRDNILSLNSILFLKSINDTIVIPMESPWFYFYAENSDSQIVPFNESLTFENDLIGLKTMFKESKLNFVTVPCNHQDIPRQICKEYSYEMYSKSYFDNTLN